MILVIGATGTVGLPLLRRLTRDGAPVRALAHSPSSRSLIEASGGQAVDGDLDEPDTIRRAIQGCDHVFLLSPPHPQQPEREKRAIDVAAVSDVEHIVALSIAGADAASDVLSAQWHADIDEHLVNSGTGYTILRPAGLMQSHLMPAETVKREGAWYGMTGDGVSAFIDARDVAAVAAHVLITPGHGGAVYELTGSEAISMPRAAGQLSTVLGKTVRYVDVPADRYRAGLAQLGLPDWNTDSIVASYRAIREGHMATVTNEVDKATGRPARTFTEFAKDHKDAFVT